MPEAPLIECAPWDPLTATVAGWLSCRPLSATMKGQNSRPENLDWIFETYEFTLEVERALVIAQHIPLLALPELFLAFCSP